MLQLSRLLGWASTLVLIALLAAGPHGSEPTRADLTGSLAGTFEGLGVVQERLAESETYVNRTDSGLECKRLPGWLRQYNPKVRSDYPGAIKHALGLQTKQVVSWITDFGDKEATRCGAPMSIGSAVLVANGLKRQYGPHTPAMRGQLWLTAHHVSHPLKYVDAPPPYQVTRITIEDKRAVRLWTDGEVTLMWTPPLVDYVGTWPVPVEYSPTPGSPSWWNRWNLGDDVWAVGRTILPVCDSTCLKTGARTGYREAGIADDGNLVSPQPVEPGGTVNHTGAHFLYEAVMISGMSGGPLLAKSQLSPFELDHHDYAIVGIHNIGTEGLRGSYAIQERVGKAVDVSIKRLKGDWVPEAESPQPPQSESDEAEASTEAPQWQNWGEVSDKDRQLWREIWSANEAYEWVQGGPCTGIGMRTGPGWLCIAPNQAFQDDLDVVDFQGHVQDWGRAVENWTLVDLKPR